jgi:hypothetical protein
MYLGPPVYTDLGSIPGCVVAGRDHEAAHNCLGYGAFGRLGCPCPVAL